MDVEDIIEFLINLVLRLLPYVLITLGLTWTLMGIGLIPVDGQRGHLGGLVLGLIPLLGGGYWAHNRWKTSHIAMITESLIDGVSEQFCADIAREIETDSEFLEELDSEMTRQRLPIEQRGDLLRSAFSNIEPNIAKHSTTMKSVRALVESWVGKTLGPQLDAQAAFEALRTDLAPLRQLTKLAYQRGIKDAISRGGNVEEVVRRLQT